ncbi:MAG: SLBB domain-containing protein [Sphingomonadaceae bacterium]|nr:SLBB domain-containing protein [Sphingomonadaceae bacterium]
MCAALFIAAPRMAAAQVDAATLQRLQQQLGSGQAGSGSDQLDAARTGGNGQVLPPRTTRELTPEEIEVLRARSRVELEQIEPASPIEREFRQRTGQPRLTQFGYDLFRSGSAGSGAGALTGSLGGGYVLGVGDELVVSFRGATNRTQTARVDREGRLIVGELPPVRAAGRTVGSVERELAAATRRTLLGTTVDLSVGSVRAVSVFVGGEVVRPGQYQVTSLSDITAALAQAGGVRKSGSLRSVRIVRGGSSRTVDLYGLLGIGAPPSVRLSEGDRIIVPVIGGTIAVAGGVARPGIYEVRGSTTVATALAYAGGSLRPRGQDLTISRIASNGQEVLLRASPSTLLLAGDAFQVYTGSVGGVAGRVLLRGYVQDPGPRPLTVASTVRALIGSVGELLPDTYLQAAVRLTRDAVTGARRFQVVDLSRALGGGGDVALSDEDRLYVLSRSDVAFLNDPAVRNIVLGQPNPTPSCRGLSRLEQLVRDTQSQRYITVTRGSFQTRTGEVANVARSLSQRAPSDAAGVSRAATFGNGQSAQAQQGQTGVARQQVGQTPAPSAEPRPADESPDPALCPAVFQEEPELLPVLIEHAVSVGGSVRRPGAYPVAGPTPAATLASLAEGLLGDPVGLAADVVRVENGAAVQSRITAGPDGTLPGLVLNRGDDIRFTIATPAFEPGSVLLSGEVSRPGLYVIRKGERLSELIARAGGLTPFAYPYGSVFTRRSVREAQQEGFRRSARELNEALVSISARRTQGNGDSLLAAGQFVQQLNNVEAQGRVVVEADPRVLQLRPDLDTVLEAGDFLFVPKLPNYVLALGDVANPGALQFVEGKTVGDYLRQSGGFRRSADNRRAFVVLPNGAAQPVRQRFGRISTYAPPPGSTIIVPKNIDPLYGLDVARDIGTILSSFISSVATLAILATR